MLLSLLIGSFRVCLTCNYSVIKLNVPIDLHQGSTNYVHHVTTWIFKLEDPPRYILSSSCSFHYYIFSPCNLIDFVYHIYFLNYCTSIWNK